MKILRSHEILPAPRSIISVGNFDGIHRGHEVLIAEVVNRAREADAAPTIVTFEPHTRQVTSPHTIQPILTSPAEKAILCEKLGIEYLVVLDFNRELMKMSPENFAHNILVQQLKTVGWVMGEGHAFGHAREGSSDFLLNAAVRNHITTFIAELSRHQNTVVSSTEIRTRILAGDVKQAIALLDHAYPIVTERVHGIQKGRQMGFPTLNFAAVQSPKVLPPAGVYAGTLEWQGKRFKGALYWGDCPTFGQRDFHFELHLLEAIHTEPGEGDTVCLWVHEHIRPDKAFAHEKELVVQIQKDIDDITRFFRGESHARYEGT